MKEQLVEFETAELAKEKGFLCNSEDCHWSYLNENCMAMQYDEKSCVLVPTQSLLQKWLREVHNIAIIHLPDIGHGSKNEWGGYIIKLQSKYSGGNPFHELGEVLGNFEESLEELLQEALKLIKINQ